MAMPGLPEDLGKCFEGDAATQGRCREPVPYGKTDPPVGPPVEIPQYSWNGGLFGGAFLYDAGESGDLVPGFCAAVVFCAGATPQGEIPRTGLQPGRNGCKGPGGADRGLRLLLASA